jgi:hypothetical protein
VGVGVSPCMEAVSCTVTGPHLCQGNTYRVAWQSLVLQALVLQAVVVEVLPRKLPSVV